MDSIESPTTSWEEDSDEGFPAEAGEPERDYYHEYDNSAAPRTWEGLSALLHREEPQPSEATNTAWGSSSGVASEDSGSSPAPAPVSPPYRPPPTASRPAPTQPSWDDPLPDSPSASSASSVTSSPCDAPPYPSPPMSGTSLSDAMVKDHFTRQKSPSTVGTSTLPSGSPSGSSQASNLGFSMSRDLADGADGQLQEMREEVTCPICRDIFVSPHELRCRHTFCADCLAPLIQSKKVECPECHMVEDLSGGRQLNANQRIQRLVTQFQSVQNICCDGDFVELTHFEHGVTFSKYASVDLNPDQIDKKFVEWKKTAWFLPIDFSENSTGLQNMRLIFVPFYRYAVGTGTRYRAELLMKDSCANPVHDARAIANYSPPLAVPPSSPTSEPRLSNPEGTGADSWVADVLAKRSQFNFEDPDLVEVPTKSLTQQIQGNVSSVTKLAKSWWESGSGNGTGSQEGSGKALPPYSRRVTVMGGHENCYPNMVVSASRMVDPRMMGRFNKTLSEDWDACKDLPPNLSGSAPDVSSPSAFSAYKQSTEQFLSDAACPPSDDLDFDETELPKSVASIDVTPFQNWGTRVWPDVKRREMDFTREMIQGHANFRSVLQCDIQLDISALEYHVMLVPIYAATYLYNGKPWEVLIHARTGEVSAKHPWMGGQAIEDMKQFVTGSLGKK